MKERVRTAQTEAVPVVADDAGPILEIVREMEEDVRFRAHELSELRLSPGDHSVEDWLRAERELVWQPPIELVETDGRLLLEVAVPGVDRRDLSIHVGPERIVVRAPTNRHHHHEGEQVHLCEYSCGKLFRDIALPVEIDPTRVRAEVHDGLLSISMPIQERREPGGS